MLAQHDAGAGTVAGKHKVGTLEGMDDAGDRLERKTALWRHMQTDNEAQ